MALGLDDGDHEVVDVRYWSFQFCADLPGVYGRLRLPACGVLEVRWGLRVGDDFGEAWLEVGEPTGLGESGVEGGPCWGGLGH